MGADLLMDLKGCSAAEFPGVEDVVSGDCAKALKSFYQKGDRTGGSPGVLTGVGSSGVCKCGNEW